MCGSPDIASLLKCAMQKTVSPPDHADVKQVDFGRGSWDSHILDGNYRGRHFIVAPVVIA
jgi:hypothetical protein